MPISPFSQNDERGEKEEADENDGAVAGREEEEVHMQQSTFCAGRQVKVEFTQENSRYFQ